jgi:hypothetical protein
MRFVNAARAFGQAGCDAFHLSRASARAGALHQVVCGLSFSSVIRRATEAIGPASLARERRARRRSGARDRRSRAHHDVEAPVKRSTSGFSDGPVGPMATIRYK